MIYKLLLSLFIFALCTSLLMALGEWLSIMSDAQAVKEVDDKKPDIKVY